MYSILTEDNEAYCGKLAGECNSGNCNSCKVYSYSCGEIDAPSKCGKSAKDVSQGNGNICAKLATECDNKICGSCAVYVSKKCSPSKTIPFECEDIIETQNIASTIESAIKDYSKYVVIGAAGLALIILLR